MKVAIASDHAGLELKRALKAQLGLFEWIDLGPDSPQSVDYPDYAKAVCEAILTGKAELGVLICGSGIGMSIAANKVNGIRAALAHDPLSARMTREHNNAQVLCLGSRWVAAPYAAEITRTFLETPFSKDPRHQKRIDKIASLEK